jgi:hypothetical protein
MAIWQFSVEFIPTQKLLDYFGEIPKMIDEEIYWSESFTEGVKLPDNYEEFLSSLGTKEKLKWTEKSYNWGDYDNGTHLTIDLQNKNEIYVDARFHVEKLDINFIKTVLKFAKVCNCVLISLNRTVFEPEFNLFMEELKQSNSYKFYKDPVGFLESEELKQVNEEIKKRLIDNEFNFNS